MVRYQLARAKYFAREDHDGVFALDTLEALAHVQLLIRAESDALGSCGQNIASRANMLYLAAYSQPSCTTGAA